MSDGTQQGAASAVADLFSAFERALTQAPDAIALVQKRRNAWLALRWSDLAARIHAIVPVLGENAAATPPRLIVAGDADIDMIVCLLAAQKLGGSVYAISPRLRDDALQAEIASFGATDVYLRNRRELPHWSTILPPHAEAARIFQGQTASRPVGAWSLWPVPRSGQLPPQAGRSRSLSTALRGAPVLWAEEGTHWPRGFAQAIEAWITRGVTLALPETSQSVLRDRCEIQPTELILSPLRSGELRAVVQQRLPRHGSWTRALCDRALARVGTERSRSLRNRILRLSGALRAVDGQSEIVLGAGAEP